MFKTLAIFALAVFGFVAAEEQGRPRISSSSSYRNDEATLCTSELEGIVYQPPTPSFEYFNRISEEIKVAGPILWTPYNVSFIETFETKYKISVQVYDAFRNPLYPQDLDGQTYYSTTSTANMNGSGYATVPASPNNGMYMGMAMAMYEFIVYNGYGELKYVLLMLPLSEAPLLKK